MQIMPEGEKPYGPSPFENPDMNKLFIAVNGFHRFAANARPLFLAYCAAIATGPAGADIFAGRFKNLRLAVNRHVRFTLYHFVDLCFDQAFSARALTRLLGHGQTGTIRAAPANIHFITLFKGELGVGSGSGNANEGKNNRTQQYEQSLHILSSWWRVVLILPMPGSAGP